MDHDEALTTCDAARRLGVTAERIRQLEKAAVLPVLLKTVSGYRIFSAKAVEKLRRKRAQAQRGR